MRCWFVKLTINWGHELLTVCSCWNIKLSASPAVTDGCESYTRTSGRLVPFSIVDEYMDQSEVIKKARALQS